MRRVGGETVIELDIRVVAATNIDPTKAVEQGLLREDLYYRLNVVPIVLPPLRERGSDAVLLFQGFLTQFAATYGKPVPIVTRGVWDTVERYRWPGNVRELKNIVERLIIFDDKGKIGLADLPSSMGQPDLHGIDPTLPSYAELPYELARQKATRAFEGQYLAEILERHDGNVTRAAEAAGLSRRTLHRWLQRIKTERDSSDR